MWSPAADGEPPSITCPFCGLVCDDLTVESMGREELRLTNACETARAQLARILAQPPGSARVQGQPADLDTALAHCTEQLAQAHAPLFAGLATDVNGMRATLALADRCGALIDHVGGDALFRNLLVAQDSGWMTTTLTEVRNRADLVVLVGTECHSRFPRLVERVLSPREALFLAPEERQVVLVGPWAGQGLPDGLRKDRTRRIEAPRAALADIAGILRALVAGRPVRPDGIPGVDGQSLVELAERLTQARYAVVVWSAAELSMPHGELTVQTWAELVRDLNETTRAAALPLAGTLGDITVSQVCTWQSGYLPRIGFQQNGPTYDPLLNRHQDLLARGEVDLLLWIDAVSGQNGIPATDCPTLVLGRADMTFERPPEVFIPVGVPGVHHPGHWYRTDAVCPLPLASLIQGGPPSVAEVLGQVLGRLQTFE